MAALKPPRSNPPVEVRSRTSIQHRIIVSFVAMGLAVLSMSLGITLMTAPSSLVPRLFIASSSVTEAPSSSNAVTLTWTAPGDDGATGQAESYDLRYSTEPITTANFLTRDRFAAVSSPLPAGSTESTTMTGLQPGTTYYFAIRTTDESGNDSAISNVVTKATDRRAEACIPTYTCSEWSACTNGQQSRSCSVTNGCASGLDQPITTQSCTVPVTASDPSPVGGEPVRITNHVLAAATGPGRRVVVRLIHPSTKKVLREIKPFSSTEKNGAEVAVGDIDGDKRADIAIGTGRGSASRVQVYTDAGKLVGEFRPYPASQKSGASVALGDVNGDGTDEIITVPINGSSQVRVYRYADKKFSLLAQGFAYPRSRDGGYMVASGDLNLDGLSEIVVAPQTNASNITVLRVKGSSLAATARFRPYPITMRSGFRIAVGDVNGDGHGDILTTGGTGYYAHVKAFSAKGVRIADFLPTPTSFTAGLDLEAHDVNQDGRDEVLTATFGRGDPEMRVFRYNGLTRKFNRLDRYLVWPRSMNSGLRIGGA